MKKILYAIAVLVAANTAAQGQATSPCATDEMNKAFLEKNPAADLQQKQYNQSFLEYMKTVDLNALKAKPSNIANKKGAAPKYIIPVVFHILHNNNFYNEHYSDANIRQEIANMNANYSASNPYRDRIRPLFKDVEGDPRIEFRLAKKDPQGNPSTGIEHIYVGPMVGKASDMQKRNSWDPARYLNIWTTEAIYASGAFTPGGYAYYPTGVPAAKYDGALVSNRVGVNPASASPDPFGLATCSHEVGHYLGLLHPFNGTSSTDSCGDDYCYDTPPVFYTPYGDAGTAQYHTADCSYHYSAPAVCATPYLPDQSENFMDYYQGYCAAIMFTVQQVARMHFSLENYRRTLWQPENLVATGVSDSLAPVVVPIADFSITGNYNLTDVRVCMNVDVAFKENSYNFFTAPTAYEWNFGEGANPATSNQQVPPAVKYTTPGYKTVSLKVTGANGSNTKTATNYIYVEGPVDLKPHLALHRADWDYQNDFIANGWHFEDETGFPYNYWVRTTQASYEGPASLLLAGNVRTTGYNYSIISPTYDLTGGSSPYLEFYYAFAPNYRTPPQTTPTQDALTVHVSTDCGRTWSGPKIELGGNGYKINGIPKNSNAPVASTNSLQTVPSPVSASLNFIPSGPAQWKKASLNSTLIGSSLNSVKFKIQFNNSGGNNFYIDNLMVGLNTGINEISAADFRVGVQPNPFGSTARLLYHMPLKANVEVKVLDIVGKDLGTVFAGVQEPGGQEVMIDREKLGLNSGLYFVKITVDGTKELVQKIVIN